MVVSIKQYEVFLLLIGAIFVPLFGVVITDYYIVKRQKYTEQMLYVCQNRLGIGHRSTCNNCMDSGSPAKLYTVSSFAHLYVAAAGYRCNNPKPCCSFTHLSCNNKDAATVAARGGYGGNLGRNTSNNNGPERGTAQGG